MILHQRQYAAAPIAEHCPRIANPSDNTAPPPRRSALLSGIRYQRQDDARPGAVGLLTPGVVALSVAPAERLPDRLTKIQRGDLERGRDADGADQLFLEEIRAAAAAVADDHREQSPCRHELFGLAPAPPRGRPR